MSSKFSVQNSLEYIYSNVSLIIIFCLLSLVEVFKNFNIQLLAYKLMNDFSAGLIIGLLFFPLYLLLSFVNRSLAINVIKVLFSIIAIVQIGLIGYSLTSHVNLGADLIGYNLNDIIHTVKTSVNITFLSILPFILIPLIYFVIVYLLNKFGSDKSGKHTLIVILILGNISWFLANANRPANQNKLHFLITDIAREQNDKSMANVSSTSFKSEFPLEKSATDNKDVLSPFFNLNKEKPNVVIIMVEGLGRDFTGNGEYKGFTPFLDSLMTKSLYWDNFLSNAGRTFGAAPSLLASLPFGEKGFMEMEKFPKHNSLISILKTNGYTTSYYDGGDADFDRKSIFMQYDGVDHLIDQRKFGPGYEMGPKMSTGFSWGYPDGEIFRKVLSEIKNYKQPRLDVIMTQTTHEPFDFKEKSIYLKKVDQFINTNSGIDKSRYSEFKDVFACLSYADHSIKNFIQAYSKRSEYANTIFIITGDHRLIPIPMKDNLCRFHVPLYIFSPMLKKPVQFKSVSSHRDITPSLVAFLSNKYSLKPIDKTSWLGQGLDTTRTFRNTQNIAFMRYKGGLVDYMYGDYFYSDDILYKVDQNFNLTETSDGDELNLVTNSFSDFKKLNAYLTGKDKITKKIVDGNSHEPEFKFTPEEQLFINKTAKNIKPDSLFMIARQFAFNGQRQKARVLCNYILNKHPNYGDVIILKGRTLAWDGDYKNSEKELLKAIERAPFYFDSYSALMDIYFWSEKDKKVIDIGKRALGRGVPEPEIGFKLAKAYKRLKKNKQAKMTIDSLLKIYSDKKEYLAFRKSIR